MKEEYFEIYCGEDGVEIRKIKDIHHYLKEAVSDELEFSEDFPHTPWDKTSTRINTDTDVETRVLIKGRIVYPEKAQVVTKYEID